MERAQNATTTGETLLQAVIRLKPYGDFGAAAGRCSEPVQYLAVLRETERDTEREAERERGRDRERIMVKYYVRFFTSRRYQILK